MHHRSNILKSRKIFWYRLNSVVHIYYPPVFRYYYTHTKIIHIPRFSSVKYREVGVYNGKRIKNVGGRRTVK